MVSLLLIDHNDSFSHNLRAWLEEEPNVHVQFLSWKELDQVQYLDDFQMVVISPGPGSPTDYPESLGFIKQRAGGLPVFGVCLGMQMMLALEGVSVAPFNPVHGKTSRLRLAEHWLFSGFDSMTVARYHSLGTYDPGSVFQPLAYSEDEMVMAVEHRKLRWVGVQFHPESFLTEGSELLRRNLFCHFLR